MWYILRKSDLNLPSLITVAPPVGCDTWLTLWIDKIVSSWLCVVKGKTVICCHFYCGFIYFSCGFVCGHLIQVYSINLMLCPRTHFLLSLRLLYELWGRVLVCDRFGCFLSCFYQGAESIHTYTCCYRFRCCPWWTWHPQYLEPKWCL